MWLLCTTVWEKSEKSVVTAHLTRCHSSCIVKQSFPQLLLRAVSSDVVHPSGPTSPMLSVSPPSLALKTSPTFPHYHSFALPRRSRRLMSRSSPGGVCTGLAWAAATSSPKANRRGSWRQTDGTAPPKVCLGTWRRAFPQWTVSSQYLAQAQELPLAREQILHGCMISCVLSSAWATQLSCRPTCFVRCSFRLQEDMRSSRIVAIWRTSGITLPKRPRHRCSTRPTRTWSLTLWQPLLKRTTLWTWSTVFPLP